MAQQVRKGNTTPSEAFYNDMIGIIRIFINLCTGSDFNDIFHAKNTLRKESELKKFFEEMTDIPKEQRLLCYKIVSKLYKSVCDSRQENFGDTKVARALVESKLPAGPAFDKLVKHLVAIIFPEVREQKTAPREETYGGTHRFESEISDCQSQFENETLDLKEHFDLADTLNEIAERITLKNLIELQILAAN